MGLIGRAKSTDRPVRAATASGPLGCTAKRWSRQRKSGSRSGPIQSDTVTPNAMTTFRSPALHGTRARQRSAMISSAGNLPDAGPPDPTEIEGMRSR